MSLLGQIDWMDGWLVGERCGDYESRDIVSWRGKWIIWLRLLQVYGYCRWTRVTILGVRASGRATDGGNDRSWGRLKSKENRTKKLVSQASITVS